MEQKIKERIETLPVDPKIKELVERIAKTKDTTLKEFVDQHFEDFFLYFVTNGMQEEW